jgi:hypothetical protein
MLYILLSEEQTHATLAEMAIRNQETHPVISLWGVIQ